jgi:hypothetical protein
VQETVANFFSNPQQGQQTVAMILFGLPPQSLFARLISHQPAVLFSQNEPATSNQPQPASSTLLSEQTSTSHQPSANRTRSLQLFTRSTVGGCFCVPAL